MRWVSLAKVTCLGPPRATDDIEVASQQLSIGDKRLLGMTSPKRRPGGRHCCRSPRTHRDKPTDSVAISSKDDRQALFGDAALGVANTIAEKDF
jgi:hypothetical protein